jgi:hypothetical protein
MSDWVAWKKTVDEIGLEFTMGRFYELAGVPVGVILQRLAAEQVKDIDLTCALELFDKHSEEAGFLSGQRV